MSRWMVSRRLAVLIPLLGIVLVPAPSTAIDYFPLELGFTWEYESETSGSVSVAIIGQREVLGATTWVRHLVSPHDTWENFWSQDANGNLFIHGARSITDPSFEVAYRPPVRVIDSPLYEGKAWVTEDVHLYDLDGNEWPDDPFDYPLRVYSEGIVSVPAGDFYSYGVGYDAGVTQAALLKVQNRDIFGKLSPAFPQTRDNSSDWYSEGVGEVKFSSMDADYPYLLVDYEFPAIRTSMTTWGGIRAQYRRTTGHWLR